MQLHIKHINETPFNSVLDLTSKFWSKLLEKDSNCSYYLSYWNSFRKLLSSPELGITSLECYIEALSPPEFAKPLYLSPNFHISSTCGSTMTDLSLSPNDKVCGCGKTHKHKTHSDEKRCHNKESPARRPNSSIDLRIESDVKHQHLNFNAHRVETENTEMDPLSSCKTARSSENSADEVNTNLKFNLDILKALAERLKEKIEMRNRELIERMRDPVLEERSPLRKIAFFERRDSNGNNPFQIGIKLPDFAAIQHIVNSYKFCTQRIS